MTFSLNQQQSNAAFGGRAVRADTCRFLRHMSRPNALLSALIWING
jgi:hypothetical protein